MTDTLDTIRTLWPLLVNGPNFYAIIGGVLTLELAWLAFGSGEYTRRRV